jgi:hypothetical protein
MIEIEQKRAKLINQAKVKDKKLAMRLQYSALGSLSGAHY